MPTNRHDNIDEYNDGRTKNKYKELILSFYKDMIRLGKENKCLIYGDYKLFLEYDEQVFAYERILDNGRFIIICNLSNKHAVYEYRDTILKFENLFISNYDVKQHNELIKLTLKPWEARLYKIK